MKLYNKEINDGLAKEEYLTLRNKFIMKIVLYCLLILAVIFTDIIKGALYKTVICLIFALLIIAQIFFIYYFYRSYHEQETKN